MPSLPFGLPHLDCSLPVSAMPESFMLPGPGSATSGTLCLVSRAALNRYNTTKVAAVGYNGASAVWQSATYTSSPQAPYSLVMQSVGVNPGCTCCC